MFGHGAFSWVARAFVLSTLPALMDELLMGWDPTLQGRLPQRVVRVHLTYSSDPIRATVGRRGGAPESATP